MDRLRVLTLNIWHREGPWAQRLAVIRRGLASLSPDVIGLQEVLRPDENAEGPDQLAQIAEGLGYETAYAQAREIAPGLSFGNALLSRHPLVETTVRRLPGEETGDARCVLHGRVDTPLGEVPLFVTHLNWKFHEGSVRLRQVQALAALVAEAAPEGSGYPPIVMGDFNAEPDSDEIRYMRGLATVDGRSVYFADAWGYAGDGSPGYTMDKRNPYAARSLEPPRRLDYIFVGRRKRGEWGEPLTTRVVFDAPEDGVWASDHFGVYTELSVRT